jgi:hypothetical protein
MKLLSLPSASDESDALYAWRLPVAYQLLSLPSASDESDA